MGEAQRRLNAGIMPNNPNPQQIKVDLKNATVVKCSACDNQYFESLFMVYKVSAVTSPTGKELNVQQPVLVCNKCKKIL